VRAGRRLDGPKHACYRTRYDYCASTDTCPHRDTCPRRHGTDTRRTGTHRHGTSTGRPTRTHRRCAGSHGAGYDHDYDRAHDEEKDVYENDPAAGDR
jgi:hypothetical protein